MYKIGDVLIYGMTGPCKVAEIAAKSLPGEQEKQLYYRLVPLYQPQCTIHTPVNNQKVAIRPVISKEEAERLIDLIPSIQAEPFHNKANNELTQHYTAALKNHNCEDLVELTMSIYAKKQEVEGSKRKFGVVDERFLRQAEDLLFGELAVALDLDKGKVPAYIASKVGAIEDTRGVER